MSYVNKLMSELKENKTQKMFLELEEIREKADLIRQRTIEIHKTAPETRIASSLSCIEILVTLFYREILNYDPKSPNWEQRDRLIVSKAHGAIGMYPILVDLGFIDRKELDRVCKEGGILGSIPDCSIPGFEVMGGSLGHGLGIGCGIAIGLKRKNSSSKVFVLMGDGELWEGSVWESIMLAGHLCLDNLILIIDCNKKSMLGYTKDIIDLDNNGGIERKFNVFRWDAYTVDGHNVDKLSSILKILKNRTCKKPKVLVCDTIKGKGVECLENDELCHVRSLI